MKANYQCQRATLWCHLRDFTSLHRLMVQNILLELYKNGFDTMLRNSSKIYQILIPQSNCEPTYASKSRNKALNMREPLQ